MEATNINTMHTLPFEKAKALKDAGFPQPEFSTGQKWYNSFGATTYIGRHNVSEGKIHSYVCMSDSGRVDTITPVREGAFYIPTEGELLAAINNSDVYLAWGEHSKKFIVCNDIEGETFSKTINPLEALADAYLILHNETKTSEEADV